MTTPYGEEQYPEGLSGESAAGDIRNSGDRDRAAHDSVFRVDAEPAPLDIENYPEFFAFGSEAGAETRHIPRYSAESDGPGAPPASQQPWTRPTSPSPNRPGQAGPRTPADEQGQSQPEQPERWEIPDRIPYMRSRPSAAERSGESLPVRSRSRRGVDDEAAPTVPPAASRSRHALDGGPVPASPEAPRALSRSRHALGDEAVSPMPMPTSPEPPRALSRSRHALDDESGLPTSPRAARSDRDRSLPPGPSRSQRAIASRSPDSAPENSSQNRAKPAVAAQGQGRRRAKRSVASYLWPFQAFTAARPTSTRIRSRSTAATVWRRFKRDRLAVAGGVTILVLVVLAVAAPLVSAVVGVDPTTPHYALTDTTFGPKGGFGGMSAAHPLGVDYNFGRDLLSRLLYGARVSLLIAVAAAVLTVAVGTVLGTVAGYKGGRVDLVISRIMDLFMAFPLVIFALGLAGSLGAHAFGLSGNALHITLIVSVIGFFNWPYMARMVRGEVLSLKEREFIEAARGLGATGRWIIVRELMPNLLSPILVYGTLLIPANIVFEATLSYLHVGVAPPAASWGELLEDASQHVSTDPAYLIVPGMAVFITVLAFNLFGDGLRDALDPTA